MTVVHNHNHGLWLTDHFHNRGLWSTDYFLFIILFCVPQTEGRMWWPWSTTTTMVCDSQTTFTTDAYDPQNYFLFIILFCVPQTKGRMWWPWSTTMVCDSQTIFPHALWSTDYIQHIVLYALDQGKVNDTNHWTEMQPIAAFGHLKKDYIST